MPTPGQPTSTCPTCGGPLEEASNAGLGCIVCLLRAGIGDAGDAAQNSIHDALEGDGHFGVYEIDRREDGTLFELGRGAMGVTYRATDTALKRKVALKIIKGEVVQRSVEARERFMREARAAAALRHENIATVYQFGIREETGQYFYAMELIEGETLEQRIYRGGPLDVRTTIQIGQQVTSALAAAEKHGLVHRDLKPANLMLVSHEDETASTNPPAPDTAKSRPRRKTTTRIAMAAASLLPGLHRDSEKPVVKIIDFGLAKALHTDTDPQSLTHDRFVGTPAFASPEQFEHSTLDVRSDIYSLGEMLWFALTGKTPFAGRSVDEIHRAQQSHVLPIEQLKAGHVPSRLRSLLKSMLSLQPASRPGTQELATRLQRCSPEARSTRRTRVALAVAALLILAISASFIWLSLHTGNSISNLGAPDKSIAVLPFQNLSRDPDNAYFADGIQEEVLTRLANVSGLKVISRTSTLQYQDKPRDLARIAKQLGVANILQGSVQKAADQIRVNVQLINARTDSHLWADTFDRKLTDIFGVESEIAIRIAESLQAKLTGREQQALAVRPTNNPEAYDAYLRGLAFEARNYSSSYSPELMWKALSFYERAVQIDSNFAIAWARLSRVNALIYVNRDDTHGSPADRRDAAKRALDSAQKLAPESPETLLALGYYQYQVLHDYASAKTTFGRVSKILPGSSDVPKALAAIARREGHWNESVGYWEQAIALDPRNVELLITAAGTYAMLRQFPAALKLYDRVIDIVPNDSDLLAVKASIYQAEGNLREASRFLSGINEQSPSESTIQIKIIQLRLERNYREAVRFLRARQAQFHFSSDYEKAFDQVLLAFIQPLAGDVAGARVTAEEARNTLKPLCRNQPQNAYFSALLALANAGFGEKDSALKLAEGAIILLPRAQDAIGEPSLEEYLALIQTMFGENSRAIATLTPLLQTPYGGANYGPNPVTPALLRLDPLWDPLRADPAFQKLCAEKKP